jgi:hypothetical protein
MMNSRLRILQIGLIGIAVLIPFIMAPFLPSLKDFSHAAAIENAFYWKVMQTVTVGGFGMALVLELFKTRK